MNSLWGILGGGALFAFVLGLYDRWRNRKFEKAKQQGETKLTEAQYSEIAARASQIKTAEQIQAGEYWMGQFRAITEQVEAQEDRWRRGKIRWAEHKAWDDKQRRTIEELTGHPVDPAPSLDPDE